MGIACGGLTTYAATQRTRRTKMQRTPNKHDVCYASDPNIHATTDKQSLDEWINTRHARKKRNIEDSDDESPANTDQGTAIPYCSSKAIDAINETLNLFREDMKVMNSLLISMKKEQDIRYESFQKDITDIKIQIIEMNKTNTGLEESVDYLGSKYSELEKSKQECSETLKKHENRLNDLSQRNIYLEKCNKALEERVGLLEQKELNLNIELVNVEKQEGENTLEVVKKIADKLNLSPDNVGSAWRVRGPEKKGPRPVIVTLKSSASRSEWLKCRKTYLTNNTVFSNGSSLKIYINEQVTRQTRELLWIVKTKLKNVYKYIWIQNGRVLVKKDDENKKIYHIRFESDIYSLISSCNSE